MNANRTISCGMAAVLMIPLTTLCLAQDITKMVCRPHNSGLTANNKHMHP